MSVKKALPKINSIWWGGKLLAAGLLVGAAAPFVLWLILHRFVWQLCAAGGAILAVYAALRVIESRQDADDVPHYERTLRGTVPFDPEKQYPVVRSSICTGEKVAGFREKSGGHFTEVMVIKNQLDLERFKKIYGLDSVKTEY